MENIADPRTREMIDIIRTLPLPYAVPLMMRATLGCSVQDVARYHRISRGIAQHRLEYGVRALRAALMDG